MCALEVPSLVRIKVIYSPLQSNRQNDLNAVFSRFGPCSRKVTSVLKWSTSMSFSVYIIPGHMGDASELYAAHISPIYAHIDFTCGIYVQFGGQICSWYKYDNNL